MERRQQQRAATQQRIFETAVALFLEHGYHETTVDAICAAAGVAKGTFFLHFATKSAVLDHLGQLQLAQIQQLLEREPDFYLRDLGTQVRAIYAALGAGITAQRALVLLISIESLSRTGNASGTVGGVAELDALLTELVVAAQQRGAVRADVSALTIGRALRNCYFAAVFDWLRSENEPFLTIVETALDLLLHGIFAGRVVQLASDTITSEAV